MPSRRNRADDAGTQLTTRSEAGLGTAGPASSAKGTDCTALGPPCFPGANTCNTCHRSGKVWRPRESTRHGTAQQGTAGQPTTCHHHQHQAPRVLQAPRGRSPSLTHSLQAKATKADKNATKTSRTDSPEVNKRLNNWILKRITEAKQERQKRVHALGLNTL